MSSHVRPLSDKSANYNADADFDRDGDVDNTDVGLYGPFINIPPLPANVLSDDEVDNTFGFAGYIYSYELESYLARNRWYDAELGRWIQRDPAGYVDGMSLYLYALSNPILLVDPLGLWGRPNADHDVAVQGDRYGRTVKERLEGPPRSRSSSPIDASSMHVVADFGGFVPLIGEAVDFGHGVWYATEGDWLNAGLSFGSMIPVVGDVAFKGGKYTAKGVKAVTEAGDEAVDAGKAAAKAGDDAPTGSYTNHHESGKKYHGKGGKERSQRSGREKANEHQDPHTATDWTPARDDREAFKHEHQRLEDDGGPCNSKNYNKINSPGKKYKEQDR